MSTINIKNSSESENACVVCFKNCNIYSIGDCDHPVCYECSTRMRVLCRQNECPICRRDMPKVIFGYEVQPFHQLKSKATYVNLLERKHGIYFMSVDIQHAYYHLIEHRCPMCNNDREPFRTFYSLKEHVRRVHELFYCDLCADNLTIFTHERRCYNRANLALHRRKGDPDDKSHKGHPLCEFCEVRYMDNDELYRHLRRDHLYCHFCDADGMHHYYNSYEYLRDHFQSEHFLCEEGDCIDEQFTSVFRTEIDLKAHKASVHGKQLGKAGTKQARMLELEFTLAPRPRGDNAGMQSGRGASQRNGGRDNRSRNTAEDRFEEEGAVGFNNFYTDSGGGGVVQVEQQVQQHRPPPNTFDPEAFPSLGGKGSPQATGTLAAQPMMRSGGGGLTIRHMYGKQSLARTEENFPALASDNVTSSVKVSFNPPTTNARDNLAPSRPVLRSAPNKAPNVSIQVTSNSNGVVTTHISQNSKSGTVRVKPPSIVEAFPALGSSKTGVEPPAPAQWVSQKTKEQKPKQSKVAPAPTLPQTPKNLNSESDFPSLNKGKKQEKKTSSVTVPMSSCWLTNEEQKSSGSDSKLTTEVKSKNKKKKAKNANGTNGSESSSLNKKCVVNNNNDNTLSAYEQNNNTNNSNPKKKNQQKSSSENSSAVSSPKKTSESKKPSVQTNSSTERKRSELKIEPLLNGDDFPALGNSIRKPPGFSDPPKKAPPGFKQPPPPGFNSFSQTSNDLTFTNSSGQSFPILPNTDGSFHYPPQFNERNKELIQNIAATLGDKEFGEFREFSRLYRDGAYTAEGYYEYCRTALGPKFSTVFSELLVLLPDINKQSELYEVHRRQKQNAKVIKGLEICANCRQVVLARDLKFHASSHTLENHFPALSNNIQDVPSAWRK